MEQEYLHGSLRIHCISNLYYLNKHSKTIRQTEKSGDKKASRKIGVCPLIIHSECRFWF